MVGALGIVLLGAMLDAKRVRTKVVLTIVILVMLAALVFTKSRGAWLGFGVALAYVLIRSRSRAFVVLAAAAFGLLFSFDVFRVSLANRVGETSIQDPSLWGRLLLWTYAVKIVRANWLFGVGMENFRLVKHFIGFPLSRASSVAYNAHNLYLEIFADLGVFGFIGFVWATGGSFLRLDALVRRDVRTPAGGYLAVGLAGGILAYVTHGLLDALTWHHGAFMLLGVLLGLASSVSRLAGGPAQTSWQASSPTGEMGASGSSLGLTEPVSETSRTCV
jgi:O-antigen ligase